MKKHLPWIIALIMSLILCACGNTADENATVPDTEPPQQDVAATYEMAMIAPDNDIETTGPLSDTDPFIVNIWNGIKKYAEENEISYTYYVPVEVSDIGYGNAIAKAADNGAKLIILPGSLFEVAAYDAQYKYPNISFILVDGEPRTSDYKTYTIEKNVHAFYFAEQEAGFLAGYAAVKEGYLNLGFIGGMALPSIVRYGYGFVAGAKQAAAEDNVTGVNIKYTYSGEFTASEELQTLAASWYSSDTEVIFACGGDLGKSVAKAAETTGSYMIGVDVDQSDLSPTVITSALKKTDIAVYKSIEAYYNDEFRGGIIDNISVSGDGIGLEINNSRLNKMTEEQYDAIIARLVKGDISIPKDGSVASADALSDANVKVTLVEE